MAYTINSVYDFMVYIVRKQRGVMLGITEAMNALNTGQIDAVETWFASYGDSQQIHDAIRQLRVYQDFVSDSIGNVVFEDDYLHMVGNPATILGSTVRTCKFINEDEYSFLATSQLRPIDNDYPIAINKNTGFTIYPQQIQFGFYWYLKRPATPVLGYTQSGRTITYDPGTSVQLEFTDPYINNIIARALIYVGVNMSETEVSAFALNYNKETA